MTTDNTQEPNTTTPPASGQNDAIIKQLTEANDALKAQLETQTNTLKAAQEANTLTSQKVGTLEAQLATLTVSNETLTGEKSALNDSLTTITDQLAQATGTANTAQSKLAVFDVIASDPKYFDIMDSVSDLSLPSDPEGIKVVLDKWADKLSNAKTSAADSAIKNFKAGAVPSGGASGSSAGSSDPTTKVDAFKAAQAALSQNNLPEFDRLTALAATLNQ